MKVCHVIPCLCLLTLPVAAEDPVVVAEDASAEVVHADGFEPAPVEVIIEPSPFPETQPAEDVRPEEAGAIPEDAVLPEGETAPGEGEVPEGEGLPGEPEAPGPMPQRPRVDPKLRNFYLKDRNLGKMSGPRAIRKPERKREDKPWRSEVEVGATGYRGNTDSELLMLRLKTERKKDYNALRFEAKAMVGNKDGERDRENGEATAAMRRDIRNQWYYTAEVTYFTDKIADVDYQVVSVLSPGYEFIRRDDAHLALEVGPAYIAEKKGEEKEDFAALRLAVLMDKLIDDRILVWESFEYLPAIEDTAIYLLVAEVGVESIFTEWFRLRTVLQTRYDSNPAEDKDKQDVFLSASLVTVF